MLQRGNTDVFSKELHIKLILECKYTPECCYGIEFSILEGVQWSSGPVQSSPVIAHSLK